VSERSERAQEQLEQRNGECRALSQRNASGHCACEAFELKAHKDGFPTCECGHTRWAHVNTFIEGRAGRDTVTS
jgi:hypothetical protein